MPSSNQSVPPHAGAGSKTPGGAKAAISVNPAHALGFAAGFVVLGCAALVADIIGFWLVIMWLCFVAAIAVATYAAAVWYAERGYARRALRAAARREDNPNGAGDGMCS